MKIADIKWPDGRGWTSLACFTLTLIILAMIYGRTDLMKDDFFKTIATLIVGTGWINGPVGWAFQATKSGGELAEGNAKLVRDQVMSSPPINAAPPVTTI